RVIAFADDAERDPTGAVVEPPDLKAGARRMPVESYPGEPAADRLVLHVQGREDHDEIGVHASAASWVGVGRVMGGWSSVWGPRRKSRAGRPLPRRGAGPMGTMKPLTLWTLR